MDRGKAQVSMEYTVIIGFLMIILIPLMILYSDFSRQTKEKVVQNELYQVARKIADEVETVYYVGDPAQTKVKVYMPADVKNASLENQEIVLTTDLFGNENDIVVPVNVNMNGSLPASRGTHYLILRAKGNWVEVSEAQ